MTALEARLPRSRDCAAVARRLVEEHLGDRATGNALDDVKLVVSELVDNAYLHGGGEIRLKLEPSEHGVRLEVIDQGHGAAVEVQSRDPVQVGGFGLMLVERLSRAWGAYEGTTHVWAELALN